MLALLGEGQCIVHAMTTDITRRGLYTMLAMGSYPVGIIALSAFASKVQVGQNNTKIVSKVQVGSCVFCCKVFVLLLFNCKILFTVHSMAFVSSCRLVHSDDHLQEASPF